MYGGCIVVEEGRVAREPFISGGWGNQLSLWVLQREALQVSNLLGM